MKTIEEVKDYLYENYNAPKDEVVVECIDPETLFTIISYEDENSDRLDCTIEDGYLFTNINDIPQEEAVPVDISREELEKYLVELPFLVID